MLLEIFGTVLSSSPPQYRHRAMYRGIEMRTEWASHKGRQHGSFYFIFQSAGRSVVCMDHGRSQESSLEPLNNTIWALHLGLAN